MASMPWRFATCKGSHFSLAASYKSSKMNYQELHLVLDGFGMFRSCKFPVQRLLLDMAIGNPFNKNQNHV
jgi:hypothetical protein